MITSPHGRTRRALAPVLATVIGCAGLATTAPAQAATGADLVLIGKGFGHGRGMSQYGAAHAARQGLSWQQIIDTYYGAMPRQTRAEVPVRVGLESLGSGLAVQPALQLTYTDGTRAPLPLPLTVQQGTTVLPVARYEVVTSTRSATATTLVRVTSTGVRTTVVTSDRPFTFANPGTGQVTVLRSTGAKVGSYRGTVTGSRTPSRSTITPVVTTTLEAYLRTVVPLESPGSWPVAALGAQAVAARSYAAWFLAHPRAAGRYDICDSTTCQVFGPVGREATNSDAGIAATRGVVLTTSTGAAVRAEFHSSSGGQLVKGDYATQVAKADPYDQGPLNPVNSWRTTIAGSKLSAVWPAIGTFTGLSVTKRDGLGEFGGRAMTVVIKGTTGSVTVSGATVASRLGLRSTLFAPVSTIPAGVDDVTGDHRPDVVARAGTSITASTLTATGLGAATTVASSADLVVNAHRWDAGPRSALLRITATGEVWRLPVLGAATAAVKIGTVPAGTVSATAAGDITGDGQPDLLALASTGVVTRLTADGRGGSTGTAVVSRAALSGVTGTDRIVGPGDVTGDGKADLLVLSAAGAASLRPGDGRGSFGAPIAITGSFSGTVAAPGDVTGDGRTDLVLRTPTGATLLVESPAGAPLSKRSTLGTVGGPLVS